MSEEEALKTIEELKNYISLEMIDNNKPKELTDLFAKSMVAFQVMKNAYNKEKEKNKKLEDKIKGILIKDRDCMSLGYYSAYIGLIDDIQELLYKE